MAMAAAARGQPMDWHPTVSQTELCQRLSEDLTLDCVTRLRQITAELRRNGQVKPDLDDRSVLSVLASIVTDAFGKTLENELSRAGVDRMDVDCAAERLRSDSSPPPLKSGGRLRRSLTKRIPSFVRRKGDKKGAKKEAVLRQLVDVEGSSMKWAKCRLRLRREPGGHMISFFSPPKATKPRSGIFCFLIHEVRPTTHLELPESPNSFVIKGINGMEYVLNCQSATERTSWINIIDLCAHQDTTRGLMPVRPSPVSSLHAENLGLSSDDDLDLTPARQSTTSEESRSTPADEVEDDHSHPSPASDHSNDVDMLTSMGQLSAESSASIIDELNTQPWFHGPLSRQEAAMLVCQGGVEAHGTFLVRQSESRLGQLVLTFNYLGRAKHLRVQLLNEGYCRVQDWTFDNVYHILDFFKQSPLPLENGEVEDVVLTSYIVALTRDTIDRKRARRIKKNHANRSPESPVTLCAARDHHLAHVTGETTGYHSDSSLQPKIVAMPPRGVVVRDRLPRPVQSRPQSYILANGGSSQARCENNYLVS